MIHEQHSNGFKKIIQACIRRFISKANQRTWKACDAKLKIQNTKKLLAVLKNYFIIRIDEHLAFVNICEITLVMFKFQHGLKYLYYSSLSDMQL